MKIARLQIATMLVISCSLIIANRVRAQGTAFTYQGRLTSGTNVANGNYDLTFALFGVSSGAGQVGVTVTNTGVPVSNGMFTVALDFGANFPGADRWLEIAVRTNGGGSFTTLSPRQLLTPAPYAIAAASASNLLGALPASQISGTVLNSSLPTSPSFSGTVTANGYSGNGAGLTSVDATTLGGLNSSNFWRTTGNAGTISGTHFIGTIDNQSFELRVNNVRGFRLEPTDPVTLNVVAGSPRNFAQPGVYGATIAGGGGAGLVPPYSNSVFSPFGTVGGGSGNTVASRADFATIAGGLGNTITGGVFTAIRNGSFIGGGEANVIQPTRYGTIAGGYQNTILAADPMPLYATIGGGWRNTNASDSATIAGGDDNSIQARAWNASIGGGNYNRIAEHSSSATICGGVANSILTLAGDSAIGGGYNNTIGSGADRSVISGGLGNVNAAEFAIVGGGFTNTISSNATYSVIGGGRGNFIPANAMYAAIPGGYKNFATNNSFAAGRQARAEHTGTFVWADQNGPFTSSSDNQFLVRASGGVGINTNNPQSALHVSGTVTATGLTVGSGGAPLTGILSASATLDFANTLAQSSTDLTVPLTGAALGDPVFLGVPTASVISGTAYSAWVSAANTVTVRFLNASSASANPSSDTFRVVVVHF